MWAAALPGKLKQTHSRACLLTRLLSGVLMVIKMRSAERPSFACGSLQTSRNVARNHGTNLTPANDQGANGPSMSTINTSAWRWAGMCILERFTSRSFTATLKCSCLSASCIHLRERSPRAGFTVPQALVEKKDPMQHFLWEMFYLATLLFAIKLYLSWWHLSVTIKFVSPEL